MGIGNEKRKLGEKVRGKYSFEEGQSLSESFQIQLRSIVDQYKVRYAGMRYMVTKNKQTNKKVKIIFI